MPLYEYRCPTIHGHFEVRKSMAEAARPEVCPACRAEWERWDGTVCPYGGPFARRIYRLSRPIIRPSGYKLHPDDPRYGDFRREMELGELRDDATPVTLSPSELAAWDNPPIAIPPDPARDHALAQLVQQHWTNDLAPGVQYNRDLAAKARAEELTGQKGQV